MQMAAFDPSLPGEVPADAGAVPVRPHRPLTPTLGSVAAAPESNASAADAVVAPLATPVAPLATPVVAARPAEPRRVSPSPDAGPPAAHATSLGFAPPAAGHEHEGPRLPPMPAIGLDERVYARLARKADEHADREARDAAKVGLYVTLALNPKMAWREKLRHFEHALHKHCHHSKLMSTRVWEFYHQLAHLVREHCGQEALKIASQMDDLYASRESVGISRHDITRQARKFFDELIGDGTVCPEYLLEDDFHQILVLRDQWIAASKR